MPESFPNSHVTFVKNVNHQLNEILRCLFAIPQKTKQKQTYIHSSSGLEPVNLIKETVSCLCEIYVIIDVELDKILISPLHLLLE